MKPTRALAIIFVLLSLITAATGATAGKLEIHDAWAREAPPNAAVMAAYLTLHNHSEQTYTLVSAASPDFERVEIHRTQQRDGMTTMTPVSRVMLSANGSVSFQPGGLHLMLMQAKKPLKAGDAVTLRLFFSDESSLSISAPVKKAAPGNGHAMQHGEHETQHDSPHNAHDKDHHSSH
ncbi:MAG: copper chaperone PCu(A)C [Gammaproteobacteria bacterium]|nr:copper chaperone PCu(A)C [Gammaproteobacteria bacterium]